MNVGTEVLAVMMRPSAPTLLAVTSAHVDQVSLGMDSHAHDSRALNAVVSLK